MSGIHFPPRAAAAHSADARQSAAAVLGASHPLVRTIEALAAAGAQALGVAALLVAGVIAAASGAAWGMAVAASAAVVLVFVAMAAALLLQQRRDDVIALIAGGDGDVPLPVVERERQRLLNQRMRTALGETLEALIDEAVKPPAVPARPLFDPTVVARVAPELHELGELPRADPGDARAVALVWRLVCDGATSPLYRGNAGELRTELARIRFVLLAKRG
jgi:hypothetical protein